jgi:pimeloyl-ACP methyl ester carboxylesterase
MIQENRVLNHEVLLHFLDNQGSGLPVVFIPGLHGSAEDFSDILMAMAPRRALAVSLRGRGKSGIPEAGYRFENHVQDIAALVDTIGEPQVCLVGHSVGATYALGYALDNPNKVAGAVMAGYPARYPDLSADWGLRTMMQYPDAMSMIAVLGLQHEAADISLWESLPELACPLLVIRGGKPTSRLPEDQAEEFQRWRPGTQMVVFPDSGHRLWVPDMSRFVQTIEDFLTPEHQPQR